MYLQFVLFDITRYPGHWWLHVGGITIDNLDLSLVHLEMDQGHLTVDLLGLRCLYYWWRDRRDGRAE